MSYDFKIISVFIDEDHDFQGNTAAVVKLENKLPDEVMQQLASDLNQPATTFLWRENDRLRVRWFAPDAEIGLCGHGSLAAFAFLESQEKTALFYNSGIISGNRKQDMVYSMILDPIYSEKATPDNAVVRGLDKPIKEYYSNENKNIVVLEDEDAVRTLNPDFGILKGIEPFGIIVTAPGDHVDFVSRTLVPKVQQLEDHATGSSHAALTPFWAKRLGTEKMTAHQLSKRGGKFLCELSDDKVVLSGMTKVIAGGKVFS